ncbi:centrosomal protein of 78 kda-like [Plakobranchus ocellatus]|uniref:Centrosomal protein of 78 kDa-like n=1 Tax=Plakobranchus ocellatus TaxID=259542 RepID=A0AAV4ANA0_9GAST|nr:centrosomal protein of 78 kda-like [Plakobranchus ocellatus]
MGARSFLEVLKYNTTLVVLDLRRNPLIERDILHSVMEQLMLNCNGEDGEYKWMSENPTHLRAPSKAQTAVSKTRRKTTKVLNSSLGKKMTIKLSPHCPLQLPLHYPLQLSPHCPQLSPHCSLHYLHVAHFNYLYIIHYNYRHIAHYNYLHIAHYNYLHIAHYNYLYIIHHIYLYFAHHNYFYIAHNYLYQCPGPTSK